MLQLGEVARIDTLMEGLAARKVEWACLPIDEKLAILREIRARLLDQPVAWAKSSASGVKREPSEVRPAFP